MADRKKPAPVRKTKTATTSGTSRKADPPRRKPAPEQHQAQPKRTLVSPAPAKGRKRPKPRKVTSWSGYVSG